MRTSDAAGDPTPPAALVATVNPPGDAVAGVRQADRVADAVMTGR